MRYHGANKLLCCNAFVFSFFVLFLVVVVVEEVVIIFHQILLLLLVLVLLLLFLLLLSLFLLLLLLFLLLQSHTQTEGPRRGGGGGRAAAVAGVLSRVELTGGVKFILETADTNDTPSHPSPRLQIFLPPTESPPDAPTRPGRDNGVLLFHYI